MAGGLALIVLGVWVMTQVVGGQALQRLNVISDVVGTPRAPAPTGGGGTVGGTFGSAPPSNAPTAPQPNHLAPRAV